MLGVCVRPRAVMARAVMACAWEMYHGTHCLRSPHASCHSKTTLLSAGSTVSVTRRQSHRAHCAPCSAVTGVSLHITEKVSRSTLAFSEQISSVSALGSMSIRLCTRYVVVLRRDASCGGR